MQSQLVFWQDDQAMKVRMCAPLFRDDSKPKPLAGGFLVVSAPEAIPVHSPVKLPEGFCALKLSKAI
ncbi:MAG TPA: hypothetical protein DDY79_10330 [Brevundimonas sp.]|nr:hypothetical protein [Brevundimonas sp.]